MQDSFNLKGIHSTIGYVSFINRPPADTNSPLVDILLDNGAVLYTKTNLPQTLMVRKPIGGSVPIQGESTQTVAALLETVPLTRSCADKNSLIDSRLREQRLWPCAGEIVVVMHRELG